MGLFDLFRRAPEATAAAAPATPVRAMVGEGAHFAGLDDPALLEFIRAGGAGGLSARDAMRNTSVARCVRLISYAIGMLPLHVIDSATKEKRRDHPLFELLHREPNDWQTAFNFRQLMQRRALIEGNAYALIVRSGSRVIRLVPLDPRQVEPHQRADWRVEYRYTPPAGGMRVLAPEEVLHVFADSEDGLCGVSLVQVAAEALALARDAEISQARLFQNGMQVGGTLSHPGKLSEEARQHLKASLEERFTGAENAHRWMVLEEGMTAKAIAATAADSQQVETRKNQVEEISRIFGVPRPFLNVDDTSWGTGVDVLGQFFVRYALNPWFVAWEQAIERACFTPADKARLEAKFNAGALLRGSMKDQGEFFARALGSGGSQPWMEYGEVRDTLDLPEKTIAPLASASPAQPAPEKGATP